MEIRSWQQQAITEYTKVLRGGSNKVWSFVDASVGSGKTFLPFYQIQEYIVNHPTEKTFHFFVTPRIKLNKQQIAEFNNFCNINNITNIYSARWDSGDGEGVLKDKDELCYDANYNHFIYFIVDESLWGMQGDIKRLNCILSRIKEVESKGFVGGILAFDECHNYITHAWKGDAFGKGTSDVERFANHFHSVTLMTGTPADYQTEVVKAYNLNQGVGVHTVVNNDTTLMSISYPLYESVAAQYVVKPTLYLAEACQENIPAVIAKVFRNEQSLCTKESEILTGKVSGKSIPRIVVNMTDRESCDSAAKYLEPILPESRIITIFTPDSKGQGPIDKDGYNTTLIPSVSGYSEEDLKALLKTHKVEKVIDLLEKIDEGELFPNESIILFQVDMLSEGVNLKTFTATIIQSKSSRKQMQQIGRPIRNCTYGTGFDKIHYGHASVYAIKENDQDVVELLTNLTMFGLNDDCFNWAPRKLKKLGAPTTDDSESLLLKNEVEWEDMSEVEINEYKLNWRKHIQLKTALEQSMFKIKEDSSLELYVKDIVRCLNKVPNLNKMVKSENKTIKDRLSKKAVSEIQNQGSKSTKGKKVEEKQFDVEKLWKCIALMQYKLNTSNMKAFYAMDKEATIEAILESKEATEAWLAFSEKVPTVAACIE